TARLVNRLEQIQPPVVDAPGDQRSVVERGSREAAEREHFESRLHHLREILSGALEDDLSGGTLLLGSEVEPGVQRFQLVYQIAEEAAEPHLVTPRGFRRFAKLCTPRRSAEERDRAAPPRELCQALVEHRLARYIERVVEELVDDGIGQR